VERHYELYVGESLLSASLVNVLEINGSYRSVLFVRFVIFVQNSVLGVCGGRETIWPAERYFVDVSSDMTHLPFYSYRSAIRIGPRFWTQLLCQTPLPLCPGTTVVTDLPTVLTLSDLNPERCLI